MSTKNPWITPLQRSYDSIKAKLISSIRERIPEMNDFSEGNIFIILLSVYAAVAEVLHYYIDNIAREAFLPTARRYSSVYNHAKLVDYHIKCAVPSTVDVILYLEDPAESDIVIPISTFKSTDNKPWQSTKEVVIQKGTHSVRVPLRQIEAKSISQSLTYTSANPQFILQSQKDDRKYAEGTMTLEVNKELWRLVDTFAYSGPNDKVFKVEPDNTGVPVVMFGDNTSGKRPEPNSSITASFKLTYGKSGNISSGSFTSVPTEITKINDKIKISSPYASTGGSDVEDLNMIKTHIPLSIKSLGVAITKDDYESVTRLIPGVNKAYVNYRCGKYIEVYITPDNPSKDPDDRGWGQASEALIDYVSSYLNKVKVLTTNIVVGSTHAAKVYLEAEITGKPSYNASDIQNQVKSALVEAYNYTTSDINKPVRLSDLYSLIDTQSMVDYLKITGLYLLPYPIPEKTTQVELEVSYFKQSSFDNSKADTEEFRLEFTSDTLYHIISSNGTVYKGIVGRLHSITTPITSFQITIAGVGYIEGDIYRLYLSDINQDITPANYNIPIFSNNSIYLNIHEVV